MKLIGGLFPALWVWVLPARVLGAPQLLLQNPNQAGSHHLGSAQLPPPQRERSPWNAAVNVLWTQSCHAPFLQSPQILGNRGVGLHSQKYYLYHYNIYRLSQIFLKFACCSSGRLEMMWLLKIKKIWCRSTCSAEMGLQGTGTSLHRSSRSKLSPDISVNWHPCCWTEPFLARRCWVGKDEAISMLWCHIYPGSRSVWIGADGWHGFT